MPLNFCCLQALQIHCLLKSTPDYVAEVHLPNKQKEELQWLFQNITIVNGSSIMTPPPDISIFPVPRNRAAWQFATIVKPMDNCSPNKNCYTRVNLGTVRLVDSVRPVFIAHHLLRKTNIHANSNQRLLR